MLREIEYTSNDMALDDFQHREQTYLESSGSQMLFDPEPSNESSNWFGDPVRLLNCLSRYCEEDFLSRFNRKVVPLLVAVAAQLPDQHVQEMIQSALGTMLELSGLRISEINPVEQIAWRELKNEVCGKFLRISVQYIPGFYPFSEKTDCTFTEIFAYAQLRFCKQPAQTV